MKNRIALAIARLGSYGQEFSEIEKMVDDRPDVKQRLFALCEKIDEAVDILEGRP
jgi:hypothetical protein